MRVLLILLSIIAYNSAYSQEEQVLDSTFIWDVSELHEDENSVAESDEEPAMGIEFKIGPESDCFNSSVIIYNSDTSSAVVILEFLSEGTSHGSYSALYTVGSVNGNTVYKFKQMISVNSFPFKKASELELVERTFAISRYQDTPETCVFIRQ